VLTIAPTGSLIKSGGTSNPGTVVGAQVANSGILDVKTGLLNLTLYGQTGLTNTGTVTVEKGTNLDVTGNFLQTGGSTVVLGTLVPSAALTLQGGSLTGTGTIQGNLTNTSGTVSPGSPIGVLTVTGTFAQGSLGTTNFEMGGTTLGTQYSELVVKGAATLDGTLNITLTNGFVPANGTSYLVLPYASHTGAFASVTGGGIGGGLGLLPQYNSTSMVLNVGSLTTTFHVYLPAVFSSASLGGW
jgi:hypothetical protein